MPYDYVLQAIAKLIEQKYKDLHNAERPTALLTSIFVNSKRDRKKQPKPVEYLDFCFYRQADSTQSVGGQNGAAMLELIKLRKNPSWSLFCFKAVTTNADKVFTGAVIALVGEDAMLLNPVKSGRSYTGLLIALESASEKVQKFTSPCGIEVSMRVPHIETKVVAREGECLTII